ncbi:periplasmic heavy metal sensor [Trinickia sp. EG282A]|uniref:periplasmic heavy metal sensor n=1 Tax=Trinickia sp. EG282A TaxID=3237013 RepID=UPI0034D15764
MTARGWKLAIIGSLALNVFLMGGIAGAAYQWFTTRHASAAAVAARADPHALRFAAADLSPERRKQFADALREARRAGRPFAEAARAGRREVLHAIGAQPFDRAALDAALARTRDADLAVRTRVETGVADFVATLTPDERATFAQSLRSRGQWREPERAASGTAVSPGAGAAASANR